jgi:flagellar motility protein MotE (MotC chaperone)
MTTESSLEYEIERLRDRTRHNEASAIGYAVDAKVAEILKRMKEANIAPEVIEKILKGGT